MMNTYSLFRRSVLALGVAGLLAGGAYAQAPEPTPQQQEIHGDKKDVRQDNRGLAKDRVDRNADQRDINHDRRDLAKDRVDRNQDQRDINKDKRDLRKDDAKYGVNSTQAQADRKDLRADPVDRNKDQRHNNQNKPHLNPHRQDPNQDQTH